MRVLCILTLITAVWTGAVIFGLGNGAGLTVHVIFIASVLAFLTSLVMLISRGASRHLERTNFEAEEVRHDRADDDRRRSDRGAPEQ